MTSPDTAHFKVRSSARPVTNRSAQTDGRLPRKRPLMRKYEAAHLTPSGADPSEIASSLHVAPALPCFEDAVSALAHGSLVGTEAGPVAIEDLLPGTRVWTEEAGLQPVLWVGSTMLVPGATGQRPEMTRLTRISADAFGPGRPMPDLLLGAGARLLSQGRSVAAAELADGVQVVRVAPVTPVRLYHVLLARHARLRVNGLPVESYHPGTLTENSLPRELLELLLGLFPGMNALSDFGPQAYPRAEPDLPERRDEEENAA